MRDAPGGVPESDTGRHVDRLDRHGEDARDPLRLVRALEVDDRFRRDTAASGLVLAIAVLALRTRAPRANPVPAADGPYWWHTPAIFPLCHRLPSDEGGQIRG